MLKHGEGTYSGEHGELKYRFQPSRSDRRHLTIIFSGHRERGTVDFSTASANIRTDVLWIHDDFGQDNKVTYYLSDAGANSPIDLVTEFVPAALGSLKLDLSQVTFTGFSKGAAAALYYGLRLNAGSVIAAVPPIWPGRAARKRSPEVFAGMIRPEGDVEEETNRIDRLIPDLILGGSGTRTAIYVLSSESDPRYWEQIEPNLALLHTLPMFTLLMYKSDLIAGHTDVTPYAMPTVLALIYFLADGLSPALPRTVQAAQSQEASVSKAQLEAREGIAVLRELSSEPGLLFPEMETLIRGLSVPDYGLMERALLLQAESGALASYPLGTKKDPLLSRRYLSGTFVDYTAGVSVTVRERGLAISKLPEGRHAMQVRLSATHMPNVTVQAPLRPSPKLKLPRFFHDDHRIAVLSEIDSQLYIEVVTPDNIPSEKTVAVEVDLLEVSGTKLSLQGRYFVAGAIVDRWGSATYCLEAEGASVSQLFSLGLLDRPHKAPAASLRKAAFGDLGNRGVDLTQLPDGDYMLRVLFLSPNRNVRSLPFASLSKIDNEISVLSHLQHVGL